MLPLTFGAGGLAAVVLGSVLTCGHKAQIEKVLYDLLREDGRIGSGKSSYEIYVRRVEGRRLIGIEFRRRDKTGQYYDVIARAREGELRVYLPTKELLVHMRQCHITSSAPEIATGVFDRAGALQMIVG
jgi:hypothetical protein